MLQAMSYPESSVGRPLPMEADPDAMNDKDEVSSSCHLPLCSVKINSASKSSLYVNPNLTTCFGDVLPCCPVTTS